MASPSQKKAGLLRYPGDLVQVREKWLQCKVLKDSFYVKDDGMPVSVLSMFEHIDEEEEEDSVPYHIIHIKPYSMIIITGTGQ